jgi:hypothetical protein
MGQALGGYAFPFRNWYATATLGLGASSDDVTFHGKELDNNGDPKGPDQSMSNQAKAFTWSIGVGAEAMLTRWLSIGASLRFGMLHGNRVNKNAPRDDEKGHFPYGTFWSSITFHL